MSGGASGPLSRLHPVDRQPTRAPTVSYTHSVSEKKKAPQELNRRQLRRKDAE